MSQAMSMMQQNPAVCVVVHSFIHISTRVVAARPADGRPRQQSTGDACARITSTHLIAYMAVAAADTGLYPACTIAASQCTGPDSGARDIHVLMTSLTLDACSGARTAEELEEEMLAEAIRQSLMDNNAPPPRDPDLD